MFVYANNLFLESLNHANSFFDEFLVSWIDHYLYII